MDVLDALILGAGFSGCYQLYRLRQRGFRVKLLDGGKALGGVWYWNRYPGARVDSHVPNYEYSIEEVWRDWYWTERFPAAAELLRYFRHVDGILDLSRDVRFDSWVTRAGFDEQERLWQVECADGYRLKARFFLVCAGFAAKAHVPDFPGLGNFPGPSCHTAHWPEEGIDLAGKRVGVIGTGASGVQVIQEAGQVAKTLTVYQRTPMIALPMRQQTLDRAFQTQWKKTYPEIFRQRDASGGGLYDIRPDRRSAREVSRQEREKIFERAWHTGGFHFWTGTFIDISVDPASNRLAYDFWRDRTRARIRDPKLQELLAPTDPPHPFGAKRPSLEQNYYETFNQDNVTLVDLRVEPIAEIVGKGLRTQNRFDELDVLILATGFDASTGGLTQIDLRGADNRNLKEKWADGVSTWLGIGIPDYPNLFMLYGPQSPTAFWNGPTSAEVQGDWVVECLCWLRAKDKTRIEASRDAAESWDAHMEALANSTLFPQADSWYMGANIPGKKRQLLHHTGVPEYMKHCRASAARGYAGFDVS